MYKLLPRMSLLATTALAVILSAAPARAGVNPRGQTGCADGQAVGTQNLVKDGNFAEAYTGVYRFTTELPARAPGIYPSDPPGGFSIQKGSVSYNGGSLIGRPFAGDPSREVPASDTYFYSNPFITKDDDQFYADGEGLLWSQTVPVSPTTTYNFYAYFDNLLRVGSNANDPVIELRVDDNPNDSNPAIAAGPPITVTDSPDIWVPIQYAFTTTPTQTQAVLEIWDVIGKNPNPAFDPYQGDDFAMVGINLRQCASAVGIAKAASAPIYNSDRTVDITYTITLRNYGNDPQPVTNLQAIDDLSQTFAKAAGFTVVSKTSSTNVTVNPNFTGKSPNTGLLAPGNTLDAQETATITFKVRVTPSSSTGGRGPFRNTAIVTASANGATIEDDSVPGTNPDPDGDKNPKDEAEDRSTDISLGSLIWLPLIQH
jgi:Domain of unknown function DUF11